MKTSKSSQLPPPSPACFFGKQFCLAQSFPGTLSPTVAITFLLLPLPSQLALVPYPIGLKWRSKSRFQVCIYIYTYIYIYIYTCINNIYLYFDRSIPHLVATGIVSSPSILEIVQGIWRRSRVCGAPLAVDPYIQWIRRLADPALGPSTRIFFISPRLGKP